jgi:hypothetical protein
LLSDKEFIMKKVEFVERKTVEHLLRRPCFIDSGRRPRSAPILLAYEPSYKSFQSGSTVKDSRQAEVTVSQPGRDQEDIIQAVPLTARREVQVPQLVTPLADPHFVPSTQPSEVGLPVIRFPSLFYPNSSSVEEIPVQRLFINIGSVLGTLAPEPSESSPPPLPFGFSQGEDVIKKEKGEKNKLVKPRISRHCPYLKLPKLKPQRRERVKMAKLFKRLQVMFLTSTSTETTQKSHGVVLSLLMVEL